MKPPLRERAAGRWYEILSRLVGEDFLTGRHGICPACGGRDRFRWADDQGSGNYFCSGCGHGDGADLVMKVNGLDFAAAAKEIEKVIPETVFKPVKQKKDPLPKLKRLSSEAKKLTNNDPVSLYLKARGLISPPEIRFHPGYSYYDGGISAGIFPVMMAIIQDVNGVNLTYHITYITDGQKADVKSPKKILPPISTITGAGIRLFGTGDEICIAEGIETAIAAHMDSGLPCIAAISANGMESLKLSGDIKKVTIYADNDRSYTGHKAAYSLANRLTVICKKKVDVIIPELIGDDFCDQFTRK